MNRHLAAILVFALLAIPVAAETHHQVSRIQVRGSVPAAIVLSQSMLAEGGSYSERDLDLAVARLRRLPFVYDARYGVEGETLVLEVEGVSRLFAGVDAAGSANEDDQTGSADLGGGGRWFLGSHGVAEAQARELVSEHDDRTAFSGQYAHYGVAGSRLYAVAGVSLDALHDEGFDPDPTWSLTIGYPLTLRQTVTASGTDAGYRSGRSLVGFEQDLASSADQQSLALRWTWDTTDDPFFAVSGLSISAGPAWARETTHAEGGTTIVPGSYVLRLRTESATRSLSAHGQKFWRAGTRGAMFAGLGVSREETSFASPEAPFFGAPLFGTPRSDLETRSGAITLGYALNLFDRAFGTSTVRQRVELGATYARFELDHGEVAPAPFAPFDPTVTMDVTTLDAAYVLRRRYATVRLTLGYAFD